MSMKGFILILIFSVVKVAVAFGQKVYSVEHEYQADVKVFVVDAEYKADLKVFFIDKEYLAGWRKNDKKSLMY
ncbi:MAG: hypothetical protein K2H86_05225 [Muribaculaceae bacterium]|nr:hypothetical protein [Muribaculaceae bacterium]